MGAPISLPGDLWRQHHPDPSKVASALRDQFQSLLPVPTANKSNKPTIIPKDSRRSPFVFVRNEHKKPLGHTYLGPFNVIQRNRSHFVLLIRGHKQPIAIERIKPAFLSSDSVQPNLPPLGRPRKFHPPDSKGGAL